jgi:arylsulfatase A-like enzyme
VDGQPKKQQSADKVMPAQLRRTLMLKFQKLCFSLATCLLVLIHATAGIAGTDARPNVLFIAIDDLNDWIQLLDAKSPIATPNLQRLADRGVVFTRAYCSSPACNPSRVSIMTGKMPSSTGIYDNRTNWRKAMPKATTLSQAFRAQGYRAEGAGKIYHHGDEGRMHDDASFDEFLKMPAPPDSPMPPSKLNQLPDFGTANTDWGPWPKTEAESVDARSVNWCIERLNEPDRKQPLFLACGLFRPHMPFFVPADWYAKRANDSVTMPLIKADDLGDIPAMGLQLHAADAGRFFRGMMQADKERPGSWKDAVKFYQACAEYTDYQIGRLVDALDQSALAKNTIIVVWSDHGYQLGEKDSWEKFTLWGKAAHIPLIVVAPGVAKGGGRCEAPVSLVDLYPTLLELCNLKNKSSLDGTSLVPLLQNPSTKWDRPAVTEYLFGNASARSERFRYIRYRDGSEELYDHDVDPHEWTNCAEDPRFADIKKELQEWLPKRWTKDASTKKKTTARDIMAGKRNLTRDSPTLPSKEVDQ